MTRCPRREFPALHADIRARYHELMRPREHRPHVLRSADGTVIMVAEASDVGRDWPSERDRVYADACDVGLTVVGRSSSVVYVVTREERSPDGELVCWHLEPARGEAERVPACAGVALVVYND